MQYQAIYEMGVKRLRAVKIAEAELDARLLLEAVCGTDRNTLLVHGDREVSSEEEKTYVNHIAAREKHIPLQYIIGIQNFMGLDFKVNEHVLIPRQDTEILVEEVLKNLHDGMEILDMCTGSGCILLSLLHYSNDCRGTGVDLSEEALEVAKENAAVLSVEASFVESNLFDGLNTERKFDVIVSNPPYIPTDVISGLMPEVREHEPFMALDGTADGLFFYQEISRQAVKYLYRGGHIYFEIGYDQAEAVSEILEKNGYQEIQVIKDFAGHDRVVSALFLEEVKDV